MNKIQFENLQSLVLSQKHIKAQAIVWLQGDRLDRGQKVVELFEKKFASKILISGNNVLVGNGTRPGENDLSLKKINLWLIKKGIPKNAIITEDQSLNTAQQAKNVLKFCLNKKWRKVIVVTSPYHQMRAFLTFLKYQSKLGSKVKII
ncbi:MAG: YdcF family protein, partial [Candidatus Magasanikbacteria bacterium]|nr:YdcF family protein [Candidatus Magasanikbacteria bacterium]